MLFLLLFLLNSLEFTIVGMLKPIWKSRGRQNCGAAETNLLTIMTVFLRAPIFSLDTDMWQVKGALIVFQLPLPYSSVVPCSVSHASQHSHAAVH